MRASAPMHRPEKCRGGEVHHRGEIVEAEAPASRAHEMIPT